MTAIVEGGQGAPSVATAHRALRVCFAAAVMLFPLGFVIWAWIDGNGVPYFMDSNETVLSYVHAVNMRRFSPADTLLLTFDDTGPDTVRPRGVYAHNPNLPRYVHLALLLTGVQSLPMHVLIISILATLASMLLLWSLTTEIGGQGVAALMLPLAMALDSMGFLTWAVNTYRVFAFVLLWGCLLSVVRPGPRWLTFAAGFLLFHFEYAFALTVTVVVCTVAVARHGWSARCVLPWFALGAGTSVLVFGGQVVGYYGAGGAWEQFLRTADRRGPTVELAYVWQQVASEVATRYGPIISGLVVWSIVTAPLALMPRVRRRLDSLRVGLAQIQLGLVLGIVATSLVLRGYFLDGYVEHFLPYLVFPIVVGVAVAALDIGSLAARVDPRGLGPVAIALAIVVMGGNFGRVFERYPQLAPDLVATLQRDYVGLPFVGTPYGPHLTFALTGGVSAVGPLDLYDADLPRFENLRTMDGRLYYLCFDSWTRGPSCDRAEIMYVGMGHTMVGRGKTWAIFELRR